MEGIAFEAAKELDSLLKLAQGPQVLVRWSVKGRWAKKWHIVEPGLGVGESHDRMLCGILRQPGHTGSELVISKWPFEEGHGFLKTDLGARRTGPLDVCGGCRHEIQKQRDAA